MITILHLISHSELLENDQEVPGRDPNDSNFLEHVYSDGRFGSKCLSQKKAPRIVKSHLPLRFLKAQLDRKPNMKVLQVIRNPKDTLVSFFHFYRMNKGLGCFTGTWDEFFEMFQAEELAYQDTKDWYTYNTTRENSMVLIYEDMKKNLKDNVVKIASFLGKSLSEKVINNIVETVTFENIGLQFLASGLSKTARKLRAVFVQFSCGFRAVFMWFSCSFHVVFMQFSCAFHFSGVLFTFKVCFSCAFHFSGAFHFSFAFHGLFTFQVLLLLGCAFHF